MASKLQMPGARSSRTERKPANGQSPPSRGQKWLGFCMPFPPISNMSNKFADFSWLFRPNLRSLNADQSPMKPLRCLKALLEKLLEPCTLRGALKSSRCRDLKVDDAGAHFGLQGVLLNIHPNVSFSIFWPMGWDI